MKPSKHLPSLLILTFFLSVPSLLCAQEPDDWTGWHLGLSAVGTDAKARINTDSTTFKTESGGDPGYLGIQAGYTFPLFGAATGNKGWRLGMEFDLGLGDNQTRRSAPELGEILIDSEVRLGAAARFGHSWDKVWLYGLAGASATDFFVQDAEDDTKSMLLVGNVGLGSEVFIGKRTSLYIELLMVDEAEDRERFDGVRRRVVIEDHRAIKVGAAWRF